MKSSTIAEKLNLQQLMHSLKNLNEEVDQSKQQALYLHFADESSYSNSSMRKSHPDNDGGQKRLTQICRKQAHSHYGYGSHETSQFNQVHEIKQMNRKLFEDNQALIRECVRLRKQVKQGIVKKSQCELAETIHKLELQNLQSHNQINILRIQNLELKLSMPSQTQSNTFIHSSLYQSIQQIKHQSERLSKKIEQILDHEKGTKLSNSNTTNATTIHSRTSDRDRDNDRVINNIKIVYQDKIKGLEGIIVQQRDQIGRLRRGTSPSGVLNRPWVK